MQFPAVRPLHQLLVTGMLDIEHRDLRRTSFVHEEPDVCEHLLSLIGGSGLLEQFPLDVDDQQGSPARVLRRLCSHVFALAHGHTMCWFRCWCLTGPDLCPPADA